MIKKIFNPSTLLAISAATTTFGAYANECMGELNGINAGRGDLGIIFSLNEENGTAKGVSVAEFSSSALAYDKINNRMYYISSPRPTSYKADISDLVLSDDDKVNLPISGKKFKSTKLAYYDFGEKTHTIVGKTKSVIGMVFDEQSNKLYTKSYDKLYEVDPDTAETTELASFDSTSGKYRGDLVIKDERLLLITSSSVYEIDTTTFELTKLSSHGLSTVTGATLNPYNEIVISRTLINDNGHSNKSSLYILKPDSGQTCYLSSVPVRINDLATNYSKPGVCFEENPCQDPTPEPAPTFSLVAVTDSTMEGGSLKYDALISKPYSEDVTVEFSITDISTSPADYNFTTSTMTIPAGETKTSVTVETVDNEEFSENKQLTLNATILSGLTGEASLNGTILNDDAEPAPTFSLVAVKDSTMEGGVLRYDAVISKPYSENVSVEFSITDISTSPADYNMPTKMVTIPAGETSASMTINTIDNSVYSASKQLMLTATIRSGMTGEASLNGTILNDDAQCVPKNYTRIHYNFISSETGHNHDWGVVVNGSFVKLLDQSPGSGYYDVLSSQGFYYRLAHNGNPGHLHSKVRNHGNTQYWEDWHDNDYNDFVVHAWTQNIQKGCN